MGCRRSKVREVSCWRNRLLEKYIVRELGCGKIAVSEIDVRK
ncbi:20555_t:CDS:1, partial [Racocetra persica]